MAEREEGRGIEDSSWVVASDGITFHEHADMEAALVEEQGGHAAIRRITEMLGGRSLKDMIEELARDYDRHVY